MTLQQLHYFIVTAKLKSFTRAAEVCMVSQPALSHAIAELEQEIHCPLFRRNGRGITLTEEGIECFKRAQEIEKQVNEILEVKKRTERSRNITIGYVVLGHLNAYMSLLTECVPRDFQREHKIFTSYDEITEIKQHLIEGQYDFIIIPAANCSDLPPYESVPISEDALHLIVGDTNEFFNRDRVEVNELKDMPFIFYPNNEALNEKYKKMCAYYDFSPKVVGYGRKMGDILSEVLQKDAVAFCSATFKYLENKRIHILELAGNLEGFHLELVMLQSNQNEAAAELLAMFRNHVKGSANV